MKTGIIHFGRSLFRFLSSLKLAVVVLLTLAAILAAGTIIESMHDTATARHYVYGTAWFGAVLFFLGLNVLFAALSRWPFKKHHTGFLITHLGIILILIGSMVTLLRGYEGQVVFEEGETARRMTLEEPQLFLLDPETKKLEEVAAPFRFNPPTLEEPFAAKVMEDVLIKVDEFIPNAIREEKVIQGRGLENPALELQLKGSRATVVEWILARDGNRQRIQLGPASVNFIEVPGYESFRALIKEPEAFRGAFLWNGRKWFKVADDQVGKAIPFGEKSVRIEKYFPDAGVTEAGLSNLSATPRNPAVQLTAQAGSQEQHYTLFARFPQLPSLHENRGNSWLDLRLWYFPENLASQANELVIAMTPEGKFWFATRAQGDWSEPRALEINQPVETGWMDFQFSLLNYFSTAELQTSYRRVNVPQGQEGPPPAIRLHLGNSQQSTLLWLGRGEEKKLTLGDRPLVVAYGLKNKPLGFELRLDDFVLGTNEGTQDPATFESHVTVLDGGGPGSQVKIAMNEPLKHGNYKIFQASYQLNPGGKDWSVLAVAYDPGIYLKYLGALVMVSGIVTMFFLKPLFIQKKISQKKLARAPKQAVLEASRVT